jgi:hypothetical protein
MRYHVCNVRPAMKEDKHGDEKNTPESYDQFLVESRLQML